MKAVVCVEHGPPERLQVQDIAVPEPGPGQVRVRVCAAGVNFPDTLIIRDLYQFKPGLPFTVGAEAAGFVDALGAGVSDLSVGGPGGGDDRPWLLCRISGRRAGQHGQAPGRYAIGHRGRLYHDLWHLIACAEAARPVAAGRALLVLGAAGGVGLTAVELGKLMGARVIAAASSDEKLDLARAMGADETINYATEDLKTRVKALTGGRGVDVVYDPVGDRLAEPAFRSIAWKGRYLVVGFAGGAIPSLPLNLALIKGASIVGVFWGAFTQVEPSLHAANMAELMGWFRAGQLKPHVSNRFALDDGPAAIRWMMDRKAMGKVILTIADC